MQITLSRPPGRMQVPTARPVAAERISVHAHELGGLLGRVATPRRLSLDCFDTLLWRRTAQPVDVFADLQHRPAFARLGLTSSLRVRAEEQARRLKGVRHDVREVNLSEIYRAAFPGLNDDEVAELAEEELAAEIEACFAFPQAVELLRDAARRRLPVMIVSDTYLREDQLRRLLSRCVPRDALSAIDRVVCSSEYGLSKGEGLFKRVLERWPMPAHSILHVGDNERADAQAAQAAGLRSVHLIHVAEGVAGHERLQSAALGIADPRLRVDRGLKRPYHGVLSSAGALDTPTLAIGYAALGPLMHAFASYVLAERDALQREGRRAKLVFLMRDAHLPQRACEVLAGGPVGSAVRVSRFAAFAASFRARTDVEHYLADFLRPDSLEVMARQLLLPAERAATIVAKARATANPGAEFVRQVLRDDVLKLVYDASTAYRHRLRRYLERVAGIQLGDTVVFVDLGYQGTAQRLLEPVFREEWGIELLGRYLLAVGTPGWRADRGGLIDPSWCDDRTIGSVVPYVAVLENLCTSSDASVVDYGDDGEPILDQQVIDCDQQRRVEAIQAEALRFVDDARHFFGAVGAPPPQALREAALGELVRLVFFPTRHEIEQFAAFRLDMNLGSSDALRLHDIEAGLRSIRARGPFFIERGLGDTRLLQPAEMHFAGIELSLSLLAQHRFGLEIGVQERSLRRQDVRVLTVRGGQSAQQMLAASYTHDGWFALLVPLMTGVHTGIAFGERLRHVQVDSVGVLPLKDLYGERESSCLREIEREVLFDGMTHLGQGLYECVDETALLLIPPQGDAGGRQVARVVFRPIVTRDAAGNVARHG